MNKLRYFRKIARISQGSAAVTLGVSQQAVAKWESGKSLPRTDKLQALARLYGCTVDDLLGGNTDETASHP